MYKKISKINFVSNAFIPKIDIHFENCTDNFIDELENSLFVSALYSKRIFTLFNELPFSVDQLAFLREVISDTHTFRIDLSEDIMIEILDVILHLRMEGFLSEPFNFQEEKNEKKAKPIEFMPFKKFVNERDINLNLDSYAENTIEEFEGILNEKYKNKNYYQKPPYFLLYRSRNILSKLINNRNFSIKIIEKFLKEVKNDLRIYLYKKIIQENLESLTDKDKKAVYEEIQEYLIRDSLSDLRLGKTFEDGNLAIKITKQKIDDYNIKKLVEEEIYNDFLKEFSSSSDLNLESWVNKYVDLFKGKLQDFKGDFDEYLDCIDFRYDKKRIDMIVLGSILSNSKNYQQLIDEAYRSLSSEEKASVVERVKERYLKTSEFTIALRVKDLITENKFLYNEMNDDIYALSKEMFNGWQHDLYKDSNENRTIVNFNDNDSYTWFIVKNIKCGIEDVENACNIARDKLSQMLNFLYYFISNESEMNFTIDNVHVSFNHDTKKRTYGNGNSSNLPEPKRIDDLDKNLIKFMNEFYQNDSLHRYHVQAAINYYIKLCRTEDITEKINCEVNILKNIFREENLEKVALYSSIIIAGTNYDNDDVTYGEMRQWLYEDFTEFFQLASQQGHFFAKERVCERFKVFCKNIIGTLLFNLIPMKEEIHYDVQDIIKWILYINPDNHNIVRRER
ncbi:hypothetical protein U8Y98_00785 [Priestia megaterium]|uniref:hypothetical protein n=1 Tax=Priestia megaterium TaxID=1404 RepID=UPI002FE2E7A7